MNVKTYLFFFYLQVILVFIANKITKWLLFRYDTLMAVLSFLSATLDQVSDVPLVLFACYFGFNHK